MSDIPQPSTLEVAPPAQHERLQGWVPELATAQETFEALEKAFDYRGDITITKKDGSVLEGYVFDRQNGKTLEDSFVRVIPPQTNQKLKISYADIAKLAFTGRDTAAGKSWEAWVRKYWEKKMAGEKDIQIEPERLD